MNIYHRDGLAVVFDIHRQGRPRAGSGRSKGSWAMKCSKRSFAVLSVALLLSLSARTPNARGADLASHTFAEAQSSKQKCINTCRARYRDCRSLKQISPYECWGVYQDCTRFTCQAAPG